MQVKLPREPKICKIENGKIHFSSDIIIPYKPMIGTIGVAPFVESESISTGVLSGRHGGNMDLQNITIGSQVFLPVFHEGGLLYLGDVHAVQGDGEISGTAVEMPAEVKIKIDLIDKETLDWPRIENEKEVMVVSTTSAGRTFEDAIRTAFMELTIWMEKKYS